MASYLSQQRYVSFLLGGAAGAYQYISAKKLLWQSTETIAAALPGTPAVAPPAPTPSQAQEDGQLFGPLARAYVARQWNLTVDAIGKPIIKFLIDRGL